jgi:REP element-mobilizing transposase RayT
MPQSLARIIVHIVFSTKNRNPFLADKNLRNELHSYVGGTCNNLDCPVLTVGGIADHVHILLKMTRTLPISRLVCDIKRESSKWIKNKSPVLSNFSWQRGFGAFSVGQREIEPVRTYIRSQEKHHKKKTFQEEYLELLKHYQIQYNERYLWD